MILFAYEILLLSCQEDAVGKVNISIVCCGLRLYMRTMCVNAAYCDVSDDGF